MEATWILVNGRIATMDSRNVRAEAVAVSGDRILSVGDNETVLECAGRATRITDLGGLRVFPGFIDAHTHFMQTGLDATALYLNHARSLDELYRMVEEYAARQPEGAWVRGYGYDETKLEERRSPSREELDRACPERPLFLSRVDAHSCAVNSKAWEVLRPKVGLEGVQYDSQGAFVGVLTKAANAHARNLLLETCIGKTTRVEALEQAGRIALAKGVTTVHALEGGTLFSEKDFEVLMETLFRLPVRVIPFHQVMDVASACSSGLKQIGGCITLDGSIGSRTAALLNPYEDAPDWRGHPYYEDHVVEEFVLTAHKAGLQVAMHAIGDAAIEQLLRAYEKALTVYPRADHRHRMEHFSLPTADQIQRAARLGIAISVQPSFDYFTKNMIPVRLGERRARRAHPLRSLLEAGLLVAAGSDSSITPIDPMLGVFSAVTHSQPEQRLSVYEAVKLFTINAAYIGFEEKEKGSITSGKLADMVVLDRDPLTETTEAISEISVRATILGGEVVFGELI
jgi:hypothetical protein